ncbi:MAG: ThuA domain-containing protein [Coraliomargaritaceae bacterium]
MIPTKRLPSLFFIFLLFCGASGIQAADSSDIPDPIKALLITGGCCHDYDTQQNILPAAVDLKSQLPVEWTIVHQRTKALDSILEFYKNPNWAKGYDVVVHNECFAKVGDVEYIDGILQPHLDGVPAVLVHCSLHCYRIGPTREKWWEFCGAHSPGHGPKHPLKVEVLNTDHEVMQGMSDWVTPQGELYYIEKIYPRTIPLAQSRSEKTGKLETTVWVHTYGPNQTRVFATSMGHHNETMLQDQYMELFTRGLLWAAGRPVAENLNPPSE